MNKIQIEAVISAPLEKTWECYTSPTHIVNWNFADVSWQCPSAENDLRVGGKYLARMEAKDGSFGFDFEAVYTEVIVHERFSYDFGGRIATVIFEELGAETKVVVTFDPETENPIDLQKQGWQAILNNFKTYTETLYS
jgi:uncharacterized protein YndB with AHSA1/START domain